jgi:hypothetical protein
MRATVAPTFVASRRALDTRHGAVARALVLVPLGAVLGGEIRRQARRAEPTLQQLHPRRGRLDARRHRGRGLSPLRRRRLPRKRPLAGHGVGLP